MEKKLTLASLIIGFALLVSCFIPKQVVSATTVKHTVAANDTVWNIAEKHFDKQNKYSDVGEFTYYIRKENNLLGNRVIQPGMTLNISLIVEK